MSSSQDKRFMSLPGTKYYLKRTKNDIVGGWDVFFMYLIAASCLAVIIIHFLFTREQQCLKDDAKMFEDIIVGILGSVLGILLVVWPIMIGLTGTWTRMKASEESKTTMIVTYVLLTIFSALALGLMCGGSYTNSTTVEEYDTDYNLKIASAATTGFVLILLCTMGGIGIGDITDYACN